MTAFVIRARYCQPAGVGWVDKEGHVYHDPNYAHRFESEADAWAFIGLHWNTLAGRDEEGEFSWPEEARDYTPEEKTQIRDEYDRLRNAYYNRIPEGC
jgi:hypothetical protein